MKTQEKNQPSPRLDFARQLFKQYYARCFWHLTPGLLISESMVPVIIKGLRLHGGSKEMLLADQLAHWPKGDR